MLWTNIALSVVLLICFVYCVSLGNPARVLSEPNDIMLPEIAGFSVSPSSIESGSIAILTWDVINATSISIDHGIGRVSPSGQLQVEPAYSTTYKLTVSNQTGTRSRYVTLYVELDEKTPSSIVNTDPVTGRNSAVDLSWEDYCLSDQYQVQIARDPYFTLKVYDSGSMNTADSLYPAMSYPPGNLESGHTYYWRVRVTQAATGQRILSHWSEPMAFTVKPGYTIRADYEGVHAFTPANGCAACPVKPVSFRWSGYQDTTRYRFILARDSQLQDIVVEAFTSTTSYALSGALDYDTSYFWQVMAIEPIPSDPSSLFTFYTEPTPQPVGQQPSASPSAPPVWAIAIMVIGVLLIIVAVVFIVRAKAII